MKAGGLRAGFKRELRIFHRYSKTATMRALSIIGIVMSLGGIIASLVIMTEAKCYCYCDDSYLYNSGSVPDEAVGGGLISMLLFVFFLIFSIISTVVSFAKKPADASAQPVTPFPQQPVYTNIPPYTPPYPSYNPPPNYPPQNNPYPPNPYPQNNPFNPPGQNPTDPYRNPNPPPPDPNNEPTNPWAPK